MAPLPLICTILADSFTAACHPSRESPFMLDRRFIIENLDAVRQNCVDRGMTVDLDRFMELDEARKAADQALQELNRRSNDVAKSIGQAKDAGEREARIAEGRRLRGERDAKSAELETLDAEYAQLHALIPNMAHPDAPVGKDDKANLEIDKGATPIRDFGFEPKDHVELMENLGMLDLEAGAKVSGHGFYYLKNDAVLLDLALQSYAVRFLTERGYSPLMTPDLARNEMLAGTGFVPRGEETQIYSVEETDLSLIATAEITLAGLYADSVIDVRDLPIRLCGLSHCFRTEAGAHGRATRGIYRVHQFTKVEMFAYTTPENSEEMHQEMYRIERDFFDSLEIPYRVVDTATGDLGAPAYRKYDLEAWMPGRGDGGDFGEVTSTSNCTDYQARRLGIRIKDPSQKGTVLAHTLNGTCVADCRALISVVENHQQPDGSVSVPEVLRPYFGKDAIRPS